MNENNINYIIMILLVAVVFVFGMIASNQAAITGYAVKDLNKQPVKQVAQVGPSGAVVKIPPQAIEAAPHVFYLGTAVDKGRPVEGYAIIFYKKGYGKPGTECGNGVCEPGENSRKCPADCEGTATDSKCYEFLARSAKWKTIEPWIVNPANNRGLSSDFVFNNLATDIDKWENAAGTNILGNGAITSDVLEADLYSTDGKNEVYFGNIEEPGAIAVCIIWGIFGGPPKARELVEWDQVYDQVDFDWSAFGEPGKMDFENIATHELGHSVGLGDLYTSECSEVTMYGYATEGETKKRSLESGDITGVKELYK